MAKKNREPAFVRMERGLQPMARLVPKITGQVFRRRGFAETRILTDWPLIIGERLAPHCVPEKLVFRGKQRDGGILHLRVHAPLAIEFQHLEPRIIERINTFFGYSAVIGLRLIQGMVKGRIPATPPPDEIPQADDESPKTGPKMELKAGEEEEDSLEAALHRLGKAVRRDAQKREKQP